MHVSSGSATAPYLPAESVSAFPLNEWPRMSSHSSSLHLHDVMQVPGALKRKWLSYDMRLVVILRRVSDWLFVWTSDPRMLASSRTCRVRLQTHAGRAWHCLVCLDAKQ